MGDGAREVTLLKSNFSRGVAVPGNFITSFSPLVFLMVTLKFNNISDSEQFIVVAEQAALFTIEGQTGKITYPWAAGYSIGDFCYNCYFTEVLFPGEEKQFVFFYSVFFDKQKTHSFIFQYDTLPPILFTVQNQF